jgi:putative PEP-CTERM system histidine kinase
MDVLVAANFVCALVYGALGLLLARHSERRAPVAALVAACAATSCWTLARGVDGAGWLPVGPGLGALAALHTGTWTVFLGLACRAGLPEHERRRPLSHTWLTLAGVAFLLVLGLEMRAGAEGGDGPQGALLLAQISGRLLLVVPGLVFVETLLGRSSGQTRWRLRYLCLGVGGFLLFDLFVASEALLFRRLDPVLEASRGAVVALAAPLVAIAAARNPTWSAQLNLGRRVVFHSVVLFGIGGYLLALAGAGALLRSLGGDWTGLLEATFVFSGLLLLAVLLSSPTMRALARRRLSRYLFTYRHDYRETWRRFAEALSASGDAPLRQRAVHAVADILDSPAGALWIRESDALVRVAAEGRVPAEDAPADGAFARELSRRGGRVLDLGDPADPSAARFESWIPDWLRDWRSAWVLAPLIHRSAFLGFLVLARPPGASALDAEEEELLETVARQVASYVAEERQTRALEEARRFSDFSREVAFIAHDLRNVANELSLTLSNARTHIQKPEFQRDLLLSMEESVARMQRMLDRLRSGAREAGRSESVDLSRLLGDSLRSRFADDAGVRLELDGGAPLPVAGPPDRMVAMGGHLIRNAVEAVGPDGHVTVRLRRDGDSALFEVEDDGPGMSPELLRERLYHPFASTKPGGFGIGLYECRELARELGGQLELDSEPGRGTVARLRLPLDRESVAGEGR